jgi:hypothetical protein
MISSRQASKADQLVEYALTLNIDQLIKAGGLRPGSHTSGQLHWTFESGQAASANFEVRLTFPDAYVQLDFLIPDGRTGSSREVRQRIALTTTRPRFGGTRWWFLCPVTRERVGRLHLPPGASQFASRRAHGLTYACQTEDIYERAARRSRRLMTRLGADAGSRWIPLKPKGMRWTTYLRYAGQIEAFEKLASGRWAKVAARLNARGLL